jgi:hypothetical protein
MNSNIAGRNATLVLPLTKEVPAAIAVVRECVVRWALMAMDLRTNIHAMESLAGAQGTNVGVCYVALIFLFNVVICPSLINYQFFIYLCKKSKKTNYYK